MSALATGFAFLPTAVLMFTMIRLIPLLLPRFGPKPVTMIGSALMLAGLVLCPVRTRARRAVRCRPCSRPDRRSVWRSW